MCGTQAGVRPAACNALERIARTNNPEAAVWTGSTIPTAEQGIKGVGDAHRTSRLRCRPVGVSEKGTRGFAQQNTVHQRCP